MENWGLNLNGPLCNCSNTNSSFVHVIADFTSPPPWTVTSLRCFLSKLSLYLQSDFCWLPVVWLTSVRRHPIHFLIFWVWKLVMVWKSLQGNSSEKVSLSSSKAEKLWVQGDLKAPWPPPQSLRVYGTVCQLLTGGILSWCFGESKWGTPRMACLCEKTDNLLSFLFDSLAKICIKAYKSNILRTISIFQRFWLETLKRQSFCFHCHLKERQGGEFNTVMWQVSP